MAVLENVFSWSKSRDEQFRECQRKYYYDKYASWGGWDRNAPKEARTAYVLKNLKNRWAWKGETVHHVIETVLKTMRSGRAMPLEEGLGALTETMRRDFRSSKAKKNWDDPKRNLGLFEHEYDKPVGDPVWKKIHDESAECLRNFYSSAFFRELEADDKKDWLVIEDLEEFNFEGAKIYVKLDFARRKNGAIEIYDWKTGKNDSEAASVQMGAYALYAIGKWGVPLESLRAYLFNLGSPSPSPQEQALTPELLASTKKVMAASIAGMRELLADPAKNIPKPAGVFQFAAEERFCNTCNFYRICEKFAGATGASRS
ncbi:MAG TPA: PD-(D/E)XK nuclease family protein [Candidatus Eisenbacteria bacterium]|nr:PD-(D/E)XK nuclease family protein [Candidatus Eisenbacteria bacterium]